MDILDRYIPADHSLSSHRVEIEAPIERVWERLLDLDLQESALIRLLFRLRGLPQVTRLDDFKDFGFSVLEKEPPRHLVLGLVGRFWRPTGDPIPTTLEEFLTFDRAGYAKAVWGFALRHRAADVTEVRTETRVMMVDESATAAFRRYWALIAPFSGVVRSEILRLLRRSAGRG